MISLGYCESQRERERAGAGDGFPPGHMKEAESEHPKKQIQSFQPKFQICQAPHKSSCVSLALEWGPRKCY